MLEMLDKESVIYKATNKLNGKVYIGQTSKKFRKRLSGHKSSAFNNYGKYYDCKFYRAIRKYGWENFVWEFLEELDVKGKDKKEIKNMLNEREVFWISRHDSFRNGYNMSLGGEDASYVLGQLHGSAKLNDNDVVKIKKMLMSGVSQHNIARQFKVGQTMINSISTDSNWTHIEVEGWNEWQQKRVNGEIVIKIVRATGSSHHNSKLNEEKVAQIKKRLIERVTYDKISEEFNISRGAIGGISRNDNWSHVKVEGWDEYQEDKKSGKIKSNKGSKNGMATRTVEEIKSIKRFLVSGMLQKDIAKKFNMSPSSVGSIAQGRNWSDVTVDGWDEYLMRRVKRV